MNRLIIQGVEVTNYTSGLEGLEVLFALNSNDRTVQYTASGTFKIAGKGYNIVKEAVYDLSLTLEGKLIIQGVADIDFQITARNVKDCGCDAEIFLSDLDQNYQNYQELSQTIISDDQEAIFDAGYFARVPYCNEPNFIGYILIVLYGIMKLVVDFIVLIVSIFDDDVTIESFGQFVLGCSKYHFAFNVGKTIGFYADKAGLGWSSSILQTDFKDLHILDAYGHEGYSRRKLNPASPPDKVINHTPPQILNELAIMYNGDYRIIDGDLVFERKDWFPANAIQLLGKITDEYCVEVDPSQLNTNIKFEYATDMLDETSQQVTGTYGGRIDLNPGEYKSLRGTKNVNPRLSVSRFVGDKWGDKYIRNKRANPFIGGPILHDLVLSNGQTSELRVLDIEPSGGHYRYAKARAFNPGPTVYQERLMFKIYNGNPGFVVDDVLYYAYFEIEDPKLHPRYFTGEIKFLSSDVCKAIADIKRYGLNVYVITPYGKAVPTEIEYDTESGIFTLKNCTIWP